MRLHTGPFLILPTLVIQLTLRGDGYGDEYIAWAQAGKRPIRRVMGKQIMFLTKLICFLEVGPLIKKSVAWPNFYSLRVIHSMRDGRLLLKGA